ncbi:hypothetical protein PAPYR_10817 [Paratrimastix pyriformis]|uniref:Uncharacterized protein n=1 Tax=Paratrimastix pyriformis TaxID=342808 RepID=A0ABQ8UA28_9EUKA|nr:hypothetical protein PAPYR_10817 [Paratrimastix pyriformis]
MRFAIKFEPSAVQFSWYELECQLREILGEARVQQGLEEELWRDVRNQAVLTDLGERPASAVTFVTMRAHLGGLPWKLKSLGQACSPAGCMASHSTDRSGEDRPLRADHRLAFIRAAGVEWPQQMQEYLKNHHIVVEVGVVCLADVSLSPGWTECFASEVGPRLILRISDIWPLRCLSDRLVRWKILLWDVADAARSLGENVAADLGRAGQGQTGGDARAGQGVNGQTRTLTPQRFLRVLERRAAVLQRVEDNLAKMWQANLTEWYEENPKGQPQEGGKPAVGDNLRRKTPPSGTTSRKRKTRRRGQPQGAALGDIGWVGYGHDGENPKRGTTSRRRKTRRRGQPQGASLGAIGWVGTDTEEENPRGQPQEEERKTPLKGQPHEEGAENPALGKTLMVGWRTMPGMGMRHRLATSGAYYFGSGGWGWLPFAYGRFGKETGSDIMDAVIMYAWGTWKV